MPRLRAIRPNLPSRHPPPTQLSHYPSMVSNEGTVPCLRAIRPNLPSSHAPPTQLSHYPSMDRNGIYLSLCTGTPSDVVHDMPIFHPGPAVASGLDLLAAAATATPMPATYRALSTSLVSAPGQPGSLYSTESGKENPGPGVCRDGGDRTGR